MSKSIWFATGWNEHFEDYYIGAWTFEPNASTVAEVVLEKYDYLIDPNCISLPAEEACSESGISWDIVKLDVMDSL